jgi:hypothetical protein
MDDVLKTAIDDALEAIFTSQTIAGAAWEAVCEASGLTPRDVIVSASGARWTARQVDERYRGLCDEWRRLMSWREYAARIAGDIGDLGPAADLIARRGDGIVVMGHTHEATDTGWRRNKRYLNCGSWSRGHTRTWVEIARDGDSRPDASLRQWRSADHDPEQLDQA